MDEELEPTDVATDYQPPMVTRLGSLTELTQGGTNGPDDGLGGAGDVASI